MIQAYEIAILEELGEDIAKELIDSNYDIVINIETLTYTFKNCPVRLAKKILKLKTAHGEISILNEYRPKSIR